MSKSGVSSSLVGETSAATNALNSGTASNAERHTTHRAHCLAHTSTPQRHIKIGIHQLILPKPLSCNFPITSDIKCSHAWSNEEVELRVEAKLWCMGMEVHSFAIGTHRQEPFDMYPHLDKVCIWNDVLVFPCRWRDLTRDACITLNG